MPRPLQACVPALALLLLLPVASIAQPPRPGDLAGVVLGPDPRYASHLEVARERIAKKDWAVAVTLLQKLLDLPGEHFAIVKKDGKETVLSLRGEAERLLGSLPGDGQKFYEQEVGPQAAALLKKARTLNEPDMLAEVVHRYLYTAAGIEAAERLIAHLVDAGQMRRAAMICDALHRCLLTNPPRDVSTTTLYRAARAYHAAGDDARVADLLKGLDYAIGKDGVKVGKRTLTLEDIKKELKKRPRPILAPLASWPLFRGDARRSAQAIGGAAFLEPRWKFETWRQKETKHYLDKAVDQLSIKKRPILPALYPISAVLARDDGKIPLLIYRDFWGIHARPLHNVGDNPKKDDYVKAGDIYWESPSVWSIDRMLHEPKTVAAITGWMNHYVTNRLRPQALFENSVVGSLSTDNVRVYAVEDFQVPPSEHQQFNQFRGGMPAPPLNAGPLQDARDHNKLQAYDLDAGKLMWEVGGKGSKAPNDLLDSFFLGPPLVLDGKLLVLVEKKKELHVVTLQPATGKVLHWLRLAEVREPASENPLRRSQAAHLAYGEGVLVCPTNAGTLLGVDLKARSLLWAYGYREKAAPLGPVSDRFGQIPPPGMMFMEDGRLVPAPSAASGWSASAPLIREGKVVFTAPDGAAIHCLRLRNGQRLWTHSRQDGDLYLGGILSGKVLIVGSKSCRALNLADGKVAWTLETGLPSGLGIAADNHYYLPLKEAIRTRQPEICVLDVSKGRIQAHTRSRKQAVPGNLLLFEDSVLSQSLTEVAAYPQLATELKQITALLAKNPKDPAALARRGDVQLDRGDFKGASEDFRVALQGRPGEPLADRLRTRLYETLSEYLRRDFDAAEKYLTDFESVCRLQAAPGAPGAEVRRVEMERARRLSVYYVLLGQGREEQKKYVAAAKAYLDLMETSGSQGLLEVLGEPGLKVAPALWVGGRIDAVLGKATAKERKEIEEEIERRLNKSKGKTGIESLRRLAAVVGVGSAVGRAAREALAKRLTKESDFLEAEMLLLALRQQRCDIAQAARATEALALLCLGHGLTSDAMAFYRQLDRDFGRVVVRDGKTGAELFGALATDKRFLAVLDGPPRFPPGVHFKVHEERGGFPSLGPLIELERSGLALPYFHHHILLLHTYHNQFRLLDRDKMGDLRYEGEWSKILPPTEVAKLVPSDRIEKSPAEPRLRCYNLGHLVILPLGSMVFALDPVNKKVLWEKNLASTLRLPSYRSYTVDPRDGSIQIVYPDGWTQRVGKPGLVALEAVVLQTAEGLVAVDPLGGAELWTRTDLPRRADIFGDGKHVFVVGLDGDGIARSTQALRIADGSAVRVLDFTTLYREHRQFFGGTLVLSDKGPKGEVVLRQYDILTGKDLWKKTLAPKSFLLESADENLAGAVEPDGTVTVVDLALHQPVLSGKMERKHLAGVAKVTLLSDGGSFYLACEKPADDRIIEPVTPHFMPGQGFRTVPVNGHLYRFAPGDRGRVWYNDVRNQMLLLNRLKETPMLLLAAHYRQKQIGGVESFVSATRAYDKRTGKLIYDAVGDTAAQYHSLSVNPGKRVVELVSYNRKVIFEPARTPRK